MRSLTRTFPAVTTIVAIVAIVVAVTETATGGGTAITPAQVKKLAAAEVKRLAPTLSVKSAQTAKTAETATTARTASAPAMYAQVTGAGTVTGNSLGITQANVTRARAGVYCFSGLPSAPKGGLAIIDALPPGGQGANITQVGIGSIGLCPSAQAVVATATPVDGFGDDDPFFVVFWS